MSKDEILTMASESYCWRINLSNDRTASLARLQRFAELIAAKEREACAQIAHDTYEGFGAEAKGVDFVKQQIIRQIKERDKL
jgi:hypothetical protein